MENRLGIDISKDVAVEGVFVRVSLNNREENASESVQVLEKGFSGYRSPIERAVEISPPNGCGVKEFPHVGFESCPSKTSRRVKSGVEGVRRKANKARSSEVYKMSRLDLEGPEDKLSIVNPV